MFKIGDYMNFKIYENNKKEYKALFSGENALNEAKIFDNNAYYRSNTFLNVVGSESVNIVNVSDYDSEYKPVVKITNNDTSNIIISSNDWEMVISDLGVGDTIIIDNKMKTVADINGENKLSNCNREWISLYPGSNTVRVNGNCQVEIISEFPIRV